jgi:prepilin-type N-terminal cleavage/methylation domain-containing protein
VTKRPLHHSGFTLIELIVVISIMAILASMILVGAKALMGNAKKNKTLVIIRAVETGINLAIASKGSAISPTEHPFAGSQADAGKPRYGFVRGGGPRWGNGSVSTSGTALKGVPDTSYLSGDTDKLMLPSDIYSEVKVPILYGAKREDIGVLQSLRKVVTKYRMLPMPPNGRTKVWSPVSMAESATYQGDTVGSPDLFPNTLIPTVAQINDQYYGKLADAKSALDYLFGASSAQAELSSLKALYNADPTLPKDVNKFTFGIEQRTVGSPTSVTEPLVYTNAFTGGTGKDSDTYTVETKWKPGYIPVTQSGSTATLGGTKFVRYRLAGLAVYDAWDNELFVTTGANDKYRILSAGDDGVLAVNPGKNNTIDTTTLTGDMREKLPLTGDDTDGAKDNLK